MKLPFLGQAYQSRTPILASQTAINIYPEVNEAGGDEVGAFYGTPGLTSVYTGSGEVRGLHSAGGYLFAVIGNTVYRLNSAYTATNLGTLPNSTGRVSMAHNDTQVVVAHQDGWHYVDITGTAIAPVTNSPSSSVVTSQDQYLLFTVSAGHFGLTGLANASSINPLDVATAEGSPDNLVSIISDHREAWLFGEETIEVWSNTGASFFPFERSPGGFIEQGCAAKWSPSKLDNSVFWLGKDANGKGVVYRSNGYVPVRISTHAIEYAINQYDISDAIGFSYQEEGHSFYCLTFPTGNETWVYDVATKGWHQRGWLDTYGNLNRHRANCFASFNGSPHVGDWQNGKIYRMSLDTYTDDGNPIYRERAFEVPSSEGHRIRMDLLELTAFVSDGPNSNSNQVWLQVSRDAGQNWGYQRVKNLGAIGQTLYRVRWRRLGYGRSIVLRVGTSMAARVHWVGANLKADELAV